MKVMLDSGAFAPERAHKTVEQRWTEVLIDGTEHV